MRNAWPSPSQDGELVALQRDPIIPEFAMYRSGLDSFELDDLANRVSSESRTEKDRFMAFTDVLIEGISTGEWVNRSSSFLAMCAKASFLRGKYGYNQILAKSSPSLACKGYAAAAYCRQSLDPRWLNNLRNYVTQAWQAKDYIVFAELSGELASILVDLGYVDEATRVANESIDKVTAATTKDTGIRTMVQSALLRSRVILAYITTAMLSREEGLIRLDSAEETAEVLDDQLALSDIRYYRSRAYEQFREFDTALSLLKSALRRYERMGYLQGVANARNLRGVILIDRGQLQDARDQFEELLIIQQQLNNQIGLVNALINVGEIDRMLDQLDQMEMYNRRALEISQEAEYVRGIAYATVNLADVALRKGSIDEAVKLYLDSTKVAEGSGLKELLRLSLFHLGDANFMSSKFDEAISWYRKARKLCDETNMPILAFTADVSELVTMWAQDKRPSKTLLEHIKSTMGDSAEWLESQDASPMRRVRQRILDDSSLQSEVCVFHDSEKNFECRVERMAMRKECYGNLFWMGGLCPHFKDFITKLNR